MKFALINGLRKEAEPNLSGACPSCGNPMVAKCGEVRVRHWAHKGRRLCDLWWENETEWHRAWKNLFPSDWQEITHRADSGERHIADVKTDRNWVIEFQHSYLNPTERRSRNAFYPKLVWVVDATRRKRDGKKFFEALNNGLRHFSNLPILQLRTSECTLLREWIEGNTPTFFDFGNEQLWWLIAGRIDGPAYVGPISRSSFVEMHCGDAAKSVRDFDTLVNDFQGLVADYEAHSQTQALRRNSIPKQPQGFQRHLARKDRLRRRF